MLVNRFQQQLRPPLHLDFSFVHIPLLSEKLIGDIHGYQNGKFRRGTCPQRGERLEP